MAGESGRYLSAFSFAAQVKGFELVLAEDVGTETLPVLEVPCAEVFVESSNDGGGLVLVFGVFVSVSVFADHVVTAGGCLPGRGLDGFRSRKSVNASRALPTEKLVMFRI